MDVAWIGLGSVGLPTARKIVAAGHKVKGFDVNPPAPELAGGILIVSSPRQAAENCDLVCVAVFSDAQVADVLTGKEGIFNRLKPGATVAILTTGSIKAIQEFAAAAPPGITILDTCFSRMHCDSAMGTMTLLVGGDAEAIERCRPAFNAFAREIVHVGASGAGRAIKLVNNILFAGHLQLAADALRFAEGLHLDSAATAAALTKCSGESDVMRLIAADGPASTLENAWRYMVKDVAVAADAAKAAGIELGTLRAVTEIYTA